MKKNKPGMYRIDISAEDTVEPKLISGPISQQPFANRQRALEAWTNIGEIIRRTDPGDSDTTPEMLFAAAHRIILQAEVIKGLTVPSHPDNRAAAEFVERAIADDSNSIFGKSGTK